MYTKQQPSPRPRNDQAMSPEDYFRELFAKAQGTARQSQALGPRPGLTHPPCPRGSAGCAAATRWFRYDYAQGRLPQAVTVQDANGTTTYLLGYDQVGSLKAAAAMDGPSEGRVVKVMDYDAFGNILADSNPALFLPLAFAGGLRDRFTGLVRFCHRDYDPTVGRFTAPDPLGDTGGDHDLYDYCVDEPVGRVDPEGTIAFLLPLLAGLGGATALGWGGVKAAQKGAEIAAETLGDDTLKAQLPEKVEAMDKATTDAMTKVTAINAGIGATAAAGTAAVEAAPAVGSAALDPKNIEGAQDFITGILPTPPTSSPMGLAGFTAGAANDHYDITGKIAGMVTKGSLPVKIEE